MGVSALRIVPAPRVEPIDDPIDESVDEQQIHDDFVRLMVTHERHVLSYITSLVPNFSDAEEILQETYIRLFQQADQWDSSKHFLPWAYTIAHYQVLTYRKRVRREKTLFSQKFVEAISDEIERQSDYLDERKSKLTECVDQLAPNSRQLVKLAYNGDLRIQEVAQKLDRSMAATYKALSRIRKKLHDCVEAAVRSQHCG